MTKIQKGYLDSDVIFHGKSHDYTNVIFEHSLKIWSEWYIEYMLEYHTAVGDAGDVTCGVTTQIH